MWSHPERYPARVILLADLGSLHARNPMYNAQTVLEITRFLGRTRAILTDSSAAQWSDGSWRDLENPLLYALYDEGIELTPVAEDWAWANRERDQMIEFLGQYAQGKARLRELAALEANLRDTISRPFDAHSVHSPELLEVVQAYHRGAATLLEDGPGTAHRTLRLERLTQRLEQADSDDAVVIAPLDDLPALLELSGAALPNLDGFQPGEASRFRSVVDRAYRLEDTDDLDGLVHQLLELDGPPDSVLGRIALEARFAASGVYLAVGDLESARDLLEAVAMGQFDQPAYLPGFTLARLGQVRDLMGEREQAVRAYRAALGLSWLPAEARATAQTGLQTPFVMGQTPT